MKPNELLAIAIPTYNRASVLRRQLPDLISKVRPHNIAIYISDNASSDDTQDVIEQMRASYPLIFSSRNDENLGFDRNFEKVMKMSKAKYTWLLGDDDTIVVGGIEKVLESISAGKDFDVIVVNTISEHGLCVTNIKSKLFTDKNELFEVLFRKMGFISILIFNMHTIQNMNFQKYYNTNHIHLGGIFDYIATKETAVLWIEQPLIEAPKMSEVINSNLNKMLLYFTNIADVIFLLPNSYSESLKTKVLYSEDVSFGTLASLRAKNALYYADIKKFKKYLRYTTKAPYWLIVLLSITPPFLLRPLYKPCKWLKKRFA